jgi:hypothetical protein
MVSFWAMSECLREELARRLGKSRCWIVRYPKDCKDANEVLFKYGKAKLKECIEQSELYPIKSIHYTNNRNVAKDICYDIGSNLFNYNELGFGDCQAIVIFSKNCPNNSLPILWEKNNDWTPLFERV